MPTSTGGQIPSSETIKSQVMSISLEQARVVVTYSVVIACGYSAWLYSIVIVRGYSVWLLRVVIGFEHKQLLLQETAALLP